MDKGAKGARRVLSLLFSALLSLQLIGLDAPRALAYSIREVSSVKGSSDFQLAYVVESWAELYQELSAGHNVRLADDISYDLSEPVPLVVGDGAEVSIDLAGYTLLGAALTDGPNDKPTVIDNRGTLTITDSSSSHTGAIYGSENPNGFGAIRNQGTLTIEGGAFSNAESGRGGAAIHNEGTLTIEGGTFSNNRSVGGAIVHEGTSLSLSGSPAFSNNWGTVDDGVTPLSQDILLVDGRTITLAGALSPDVRILVGASGQALSEHGFVQITQNLGSFGSADNFVSSLSAYAVGRVTSGEAALGTPLDITVDDAIVGGKVSTDKEHAICGELVTLKAEPDADRTFGWYTVTDGTGTVLPVDKDKGTFEMPAGPVTVSATFLEDVTINISWHVHTPDCSWDSIPAVYDTQGHYEVRTAYDTGDGPRYTDWETQDRDNTDYDFTRHMDQYGPGAYGLEVKAFDGDGHLVASGVSTSVVFHKLTVTLNTVDEQGEPLQNQKGGSVFLDFESGTDDGAYTTRAVYSSDSIITLTTNPSDGFVTGRLTVDGVEVEDGYQLEFDGDHEVTATFRKDNTRVPATITLDDGHEDVAQAIAAALNADDTAYAATANDDVVSFSVLKAQTRNTAFNKVQDVLEGIGIRRWNNERLLALRKDYDNYDEWQDDTENFAIDVPLADRLDLFLIWLQEIEEVNVSVESPTCGTEVAMFMGENGGSKQTNTPKVTAEGNAACSGALWMGSEEPFEGTIEGGRDYTARIHLDSKFGYVLAEDVHVKVNGRYVDSPEPESDTVEARVRAVHDWEGAECRACHVGRANVTFDAGDEGATGSMEPLSVGVGESFALPACGFAAPAQREFSHWLVRVGDAEPRQMEVGDAVTATGDVTATAAYAEASTAPEFKSYGITLTGQIGLNVFLKLPEVEGASYEGSYVAFTVDGARRGRTVEVPLDPTFRDQRTGTYYGFTLPLASIEMAQSVTATFHYAQDGADATVSKEGVTVENYLNGWIATGITGTDLELAQALADYGYHVQQFLSQWNGWSLGGDYTATQTVFTRSYDTDAIKQALTGYRLDKDLGKSAVSDVSVMLELGSETTLDIWLTLKEGAEFSDVRLVTNGMFSPCTPERVGDRYRVRVEGIRAQNLNNAIEVSGATTTDGQEDGNFSVTASPLGYIYAALDADAFAKNHGREAICALYNYYKAASDYRASH